MGTIVLSNSRDFWTNPFFHGKSFIMPCCFLEHNCAGNIRIWLSLANTEFTELRIPFDEFPATLTGTENGARPGNAAKNEFSKTFTLPSLHLLPMMSIRIRPSIPPNGWLLTKQYLDLSSILRFSAPITLTQTSKNFREASTKSKPTLSLPSLARNWFNSSWWMSFSNGLTKNLGRFLPSFSWISLWILIWNMFLLFICFHVRV